MLESVFADVAQQFLHFGNANHSGPAERFERVVGKLAFSNIAGDGAFAIVGRETRVTHRAALHPPHAGSESVFLAHGSRNDLLEIHAHFLAKVLRPTAAMQ